MSQTVLIAELIIVPGQLENYLTRGRRHRETVLASEPHCRQFDILVNAEKENSVFLYEVYDDMAALAFHRQTSHMAAYQADTKPMVRTRILTLTEMRNAP
ncbi:MAG: putative quinol monooxygenase [Alphaproteobacteria bacterium]|nr:putative quinol monooxygenase [Alphaproteobacteria bacterium]